MEWFNSLQSRERYMLVAAAVVVALVLFYVAVWDPMVSSVARLEKSVDSAQRQLVWMNNASSEILAHRRSGEQPAAARLNVSLITAVETTAKASGVRKAMTRMEPQGSSKITVELKKVDFDQLVGWIEKLGHEYGASVSQFSTRRTDGSGLVDARLIIVRQAGQTSSVRAYSIDFSGTREVA